KLVQGSFPNAFESRTAEDGMSRACQNAFGLLFAKRLCRMDQGSCVIDHVFDGDDVLPPHLADDIHYFCFVGYYAPLVYHRQDTAQTFRQRHAASYAAAVTRDQ